MRIKITSVFVEHVAKGKTGYDVANVAYTSDRGEAKEKKIMSFANPSVFAAVQQLINQDVDVTVTKNGQFFEWSNVVAAGAGGSTPVGTPGSAPTTRVTGSNYETASERATRQVAIAKQSSLKVAVDMLSPGAKTALNADEVIELAQKLTDWVVDNGVTEST